MKKIQILLAAVLTLGFVSCERELFNSSTEVDSEELTVETENLVLKEAVADDIISSAEYEADYFTGSDDALKDMGMAELKSTNGHRFGRRYLLNNAPEVTIDSTDGGFPVTITLDYGDGTELENGKVLSGKIVIKKTDRRLADSSSRTVTYEDFFIDSLNLVGGYVSTFYAGATNDEGTFLTTRDVSLVFPDDTSIDRVGSHSRVWVSGLSTHFLISDDVIHITGSSNCTNTEGDIYIRTITETLVKKGECRFIVEGEITYNKNGNIIKLDYGDGECDNIATITKDGEVKEIKLGKWHRRNQLRK